MPRCRFERDSSSKNTLGQEDSRRRSAVSKPSSNTLKLGFFLVHSFENQLFLHPGEPTWARIDHKSNLFLFYRFLTLERQNAICYLEHGLKRCSFVSPTVARTKFFVPLLVVFFSSPFASMNKQKFLKMQIYLHAYQSDLGFGHVCVCVCVFCLSRPRATTKLRVLKWRRLNKNLRSCCVCVCGLCSFCDQLFWKSFWESAVLFFVHLLSLDPHSSSRTNLCPERVDSLVVLGNRTSFEKGVEFKINSCVFTLTTFRTSVFVDFGSETTDFNSHTHKTVQTPCPDTDSRNLLLYTMKTSLLQRVSFPIASNLLLLLLHHLHLYSFSYFLLSFALSRVCVCEHSSNEKSWQINLVANRR